MQKALLASIILLAFLAGCSKNDDPEPQVTNSGEFQFQGSKYSTEFAAFAAEDTDALYLIFYSRGLDFSGEPAGYSDHGYHISLQVSNSIYHSSDYSIDNLRSGETIDIAGGILNINLISNSGQFTEYEIDHGSVSCTNDGGFYLFEYEFSLDNGEEITGRYSGGLLVF